MGLKNLNGPNRHSVQKGNWVQATWEASGIMDSTGFHHWFLDQRHDIWPWTPGLSIRDVLSGESMVSSP